MKIIQGFDGMNIIKDKTFDEERALYNLKDTKVQNCTFAGVADGESVLKETRSIVVESCAFSLRYPMWHAQKYSLLNSKLDEFTRAPIWYSKDGIIDSTEILSVKALRECKNTVIKNSNIVSAEFGWKCDGIKIENSTIVSEYMCFDSKNVQIKNLKFTGKYSFQYMENLTIEDSVLDTKDAFWHSKNVVVKNSVVKGEYLAWFSEDLTLINCKIIGTQPLCYCKNLKLVDCEMIDCDFAFERSDVEATITTPVISIKNVYDGSVTVPSVQEVIWDSTEFKGTVVILDKGQ